MKPLINRRVSSGFTLVEAMLVVTIIGVLASVAFPRFAGLVKKAKESEIKSSLGTVRSAISIYYSDQEGAYPDNLTEGLAGGGKYLARMPSVSIPAVSAGTSGHAESSGEKILSAADDDVNAGIWWYFGPTGDDAGQVHVNCTHFDSRGEIWSTF